MKKSLMPLALSLLCIAHVWADELPKDTVKIVDIEEVVIVATPKENRKLREQPISSTLLSQQDMRINQVTSIKNLTALVPNMFIPDYGSKMTSAIYIRGIGSRINTPSVGLYVDNMPYIDKSAFDFNYADIERIDVLRGPQGTLYGRNTMGGLIKVYTKSPFDYQGTDFKMSAGTYNDYSTSVTHYHRVSNKFAFSAGGFYQYTGGFFENEAQNNKKTGQVSQGGGRMRGIYLPTDKLKIDLSLSYEYSDQDGYPYYYTGKVNPDPTKPDDRASKIGKISTDGETGYYRSLFNSGANVEYQAKNFILSSVTGYQHMRDRMSLDQDFTEIPLFTMTQSQKINTLSEEIVLKSKPGKNWQWTTGAFGFYQWLKTDAPVTFQRQGIETMIEDNANKAFQNLGPRAPKMHLTINDQTLLINDKFDTPTLNTAIYHQSTFRNLFVEGLSFTAGLRLDYEKTTLKYDASGTIDFDFDLSMPPYLNLTDNMQAPAQIKGELSDDYLQLLPKFALEYEWKKGNNVYASVSRGYRAGGYNLQLFSDLVSSALQNSMKTALMESDVYKSQAGMIAASMPSTTIAVDSATSYKPESSWNYEIGSHLTLWEGRLWADLAAFYMDTKNQQISKFVESGLGRIIVNAGKSRSYGAEIALRASITESLSFNAGYGYTYATFTDYVTNEKNNNLVTTVNYNGNYVPFVPKHTFNVGGQYIFFIAPNHLLDQVQVNLNYNGAGRMYWTEQNNVSQSFYGTLNGRVSLTKGNAEMALWARNILDKKYNTFYFENMENGFAQRGRPMQVGIDLRCRF